MTIDFEKLIDLLPTLFMLILPGALFLSTYRFCVFEKQNNNAKLKFFDVETIVVSYVLQIFVGSILKFIGIAQMDILIILISPILGLICGKIRTWQWLDEKIGDSFSRTISTNPWYTLSDRQKGSYIKVYLKEEKIYYYGIYRRYFIQENETWLVVSDYEVNEGDSIKEKKNSLAMINTKDINRVEMFFSPDSNKL